MENTAGWEWPLNVVAGRAYCFNQRSLERLTDKRYLEGYGFKVYSQYDEDGILQEIFRRVGTTDRRFVEFGVENGLECNSHYLLLQGWQGLWIEGSEAHYWSIQYRFYHAIHSGMLQVANRMVTKDNINRIIAEHGIQGEIDLLSVDIDTNDYYVLKAIDVIRPRVVVAEYNAKFPPPVEWTRIYDESHGWDGSDDMGVSLSLLDRMMNEKGYALVGTNLSGVNAFFVRQDLLGDHFLYEHTAEHLYNAARYGGGNGLYFGGGTSGKEIFGQPVCKWLSDRGSSKAERNRSRPRAAGRASPSRPGDSHIHLGCCG